MSQFSLAVDWSLFFKPPSFANRIPPSLGRPLLLSHEVWETHGWKQVGSHVQVKLLQVREDAVDPEIPKVKTPQCSQLWVICVCRCSTVSLHVTTTFSLPEGLIHTPLLLPRLTLSLENMKRSFPTVNLYMPRNWVVPPNFDWLRPITLTNSTTPQKKMGWCTRRTSRAARRRSRDPSEAAAGSPGRPWNLTTL